MRILALYNIYIYIYYLFLTGDTDFPQEVVLGGSALTNHQHDEVREWVLAVSLDQNISQVRKYLIITKHMPM